jgi:Fe-S-cluster containining protein
MKRLYPAMDKKISRILRKLERAGHTVACRICADPVCCDQLISTFPEEVVVIAEDLTAKFGGEEKHELSKKLLSWLEWYRTLPDEKKYRDTPYAKEKRACPLLKEGRCSVYEVRPTACRGHYALNQAPEVCGDLTTTDILFDPNEITFPALKEVIRSLVIMPMPLTLCYLLEIGDVSQEELSTAHHEIMKGRVGPQK